MANDDAQRRLRTRHYLFILQCQVIAFLNPDSTGIRRHLLPSRVEKGRRFMTFHDACTTSSGWCMSNLLWDMSVMQDSHSISQVVAGMAVAGISWYTVVPLLKDHHHLSLEATTPRHKNACFIGVPPSPRKNHCSWKPWPLLVNYRVCGLSRGRLCSSISQYYCQV